MLWAIWVVSGADTTPPWPVIPLLGWGIGLVAHWYGVYWRSEERRQAEIQREIIRLRGA